MTEQFQLADWLLLGLTTVLAFMGLFRGFSGALAFCLAAAGAAFVGGFGWPWSAQFLEATWMRAAATLVAVLLAFGIVRVIVRKLVNGLLSQPADSIFGLVLGVVIGAAVLVAWAWSGFYPEYSYLVKMVAPYVR